MTSLFDQFEQASMKTRNNNFTTAEMVMTKQPNYLLPSLKTPHLELAGIHQHDPGTRRPHFQQDQKRLHTLGQNHARRYRKQATGCGDGQQHLVPYESEQPPAT
jgi:hypothetical protein